MAMIHLPGSTERHRDATEPDGPDGTSGDHAVVPNIGRRNHALLCTDRGARRDPALDLAHPRLCRLAHQARHWRSMLKSTAADQIAGPQGLPGEARRVPRHASGIPPVEDRSASSALPIAASRLTAATATLTADGSQEGPQPRSGRSALPRSRLPIAMAGGCRKRSSYRCRSRVTDLNRMIHRYANNSARA